MLPYVILFFGLLVFSSDKNISDGNAFLSNAGLDSELFLASKKDDEFSIDENSDFTCSETSAESQSKKGLSLRGVAERKLLSKKDSSDESLDSFPNSDAQVSKFQLSLPPAKSGKNWTEEFSNYSELLRDSFSSKGISRWFKIASSENLSERKFEIVRVIDFFVLEISLVSEEEIHACLSKSNNPKVSHNIRILTKQEDNNWFERWHMFGLSYTPGAPLMMCLDSNCSALPAEFIDDDQVYDMTWRFGDTELNDNVEFRQAHLYHRLMKEEDFQKLLARGAPKLTKLRKQGKNLGDDSLNPIDRGKRKTKKESSPVWAIVIISVGSSILGVSCVLLIFVYRETIFGRCCFSSNTTIQKSQKPIEITPEMEKALTEWIEMLDYRRRCEEQFRA
jgi:hypothetical protein